MSREGAWEGGCGMGEQQEAGGQAGSLDDGKDASAWEGWWQQ